MSFTTVQFTCPHHPGLGGLYTAQEDFRQILNAPIVELTPFPLQQPTEGDYSIRLLGGDPLAKFGLPIDLFPKLLSLSKLKIDFVIIHSLFHLSAAIGYCFAKWHRIPFLFVPHGTLYPYVFSYRSHRKLLWMKLLGQAILDQATAVICTTEKEAATVRHHALNARVEICPWGVRLPSSEQLASRAAMRQRLGIAPNEKLLLFWGRLSRMKRILETVAAFARLDLPGWKFLLVGYPEERTIVQALAKWDANPNIINHAAVQPSDKWGFFAAADAFVNLSRRENFGYAIVEAALAGLPLLLSDQVDLYPLFQAAGAANVIHIEQEADLLLGLGDFLTRSTADLQAMGQRARQVAEAHFAYSIFQERLQAVVSESTVFQSFSDG